MHNHDPFSTAMRRPPGWLESAEIKDDPRWEGGIIPKPRIDRMVVLKPSLLRLLGHVVVWAAIYAVIPMLSTSEGFFLGIMMAIDILFAVPKFLTERTTLTADGIERVNLFGRRSFGWDAFHMIDEDKLGISLRMIRPWGIWLDEYNFHLSNLYYSPSDVVLLRYLTGRTEIDNGFVNLNS